MDLHHLCYEALACLHLVRLRNSMQAERTFFLSNLKLDEGLGDLHAVKLEIEVQ